jgi:hypothetical protein
MEPTYSQYTPFTQVNIYSKNKTSQFFHPRKIVPGKTRNVKGEKRSISIPVTQLQTRGGKRKTRNKRKTHKHKK